MGYSLFFFAINGVYTESVRQAAGDRFLILEFTVTGWLYNILTLPIVAISTLLNLCVLCAVIIASC